MEELDDRVVVEECHGGPFDVVVCVCVGLRSGG